MPSSQDRRNAPGVTRSGFVRAAFHCRAEPPHGSANHRAWRRAIEDAGLRVLSFPLHPLAAIQSDPGAALVAMDFDGTLSPIVADPQAAYAHPGAAPALCELSERVGTLAVITGRPAGEAVEIGRAHV